MLLESKIFASHKQYSQLHLTPYVQNDIKHFSPTAAIILQKKQFANAKERGV